MSVVADLEQKIHNGRCPVGRGGYAHAVASFGEPRRVPVAQTPAAKLANSGLAPEGGGRLKVPASVTHQVGDPPAGFGKWIDWSPKDPELALVAFLNAADPSGVAIRGVRPNDRVTLVAASGHASFAEKIENEGVPALIGAVAAGADLAATVFGHPEAVEAINAGAAFATEKFKEKAVKTKIRDAYGEDPGSHDKARQEGGVLVCAPTAHGPLASGEDEKWWIKEPGTRIDANRPPHIASTKSYFVRRGMGRHTFGDRGRSCSSRGDHRFTDNAGFLRTAADLQARPRPILAHRSSRRWKSSEPWMTVRSFGACSRSVGGSGHGASLRVPADAGIAEPADVPGVVAVAGRGAQRLRQQRVELVALGGIQPVEQRVERLQPGGADTGRRRRARLGEAHLDGAPVVRIPAQLDELRPAQRLHDADAAGVAEAEHAPQLVDRAAVGHGLQRHQRRAPGRLGAGRVAHAVAGDQRQRAEQVRGAAHSRAWPSITPSSARNSGCSRRSMRPGCAR